MYAASLNGFERDAQNNNIATKIIAISVATYCNFSYAFYVFIFIHIWFLDYNVIFEMFVLSSL